MHSFFFALFIPYLIVPFVFFIFFFEVVVSMKSDTFLYYTIFSFLQKMASLYSSCNN